MGKARGGVETTTPAAGQTRWTRIAPAEISSAFDADKILGGARIDPGAGSVDHRLRRQHDLRRGAHEWQHHHSRRRLWHSRVGPFLEQGIWQRPDEPDPAPHSYPLGPHP